MTTPGFSLTRLMTTVAAPLVLVVATTTGCASANITIGEPSTAGDGKTLVIPDNSRPKEAYVCNEPTATSTTATVLAAGVGHWLDKKSGGGRDHERDLGRAAHAVTSACVLKAPDAASGPR